MRQITPNELKRLFPQASADTISRNQVGATGLHPVEPEPVKRRSLVRRVPRKEACGPRFEIVFTIYAVRPCDWDGWHIKPTQDLLAAIGLLPGDAWHQLEGRVRSRKVHTAEEERTEIIIEKCSSI